MRRKWLENPGGGISEIQTLAPETEQETTEEKGTEAASTEMPKVRGTETTERQETGLTQRKAKKPVKKKMLSENGQTLLDVSQGDIRITENGATGGGLSQDETCLNPKGYWITGTTTSNNIEVLEGVETDITLDNVSITIGKVNTTTSKWDCINVSHADVTINLIGENRLICNSGSSADGFSGSTGAALAKDGMNGTPFQENTAIEVGKFYTKVYFGLFRDTNQIEKDTKEQIGANHVISKTGGEAFTKEQLKGLTKVTGKQENGTDFSMDDLRFEFPEQIEAINKAKAEKKLGEYPLVFTTPNGTKTTVKVCLKAEGTDAAKVDPEHLEVTIGANSFSKETGGLALTADDVRTLSSVQGKDAEGTTYKDEHLIPNEKELKTINDAKTAGKAGKFELTFTSPDKKSVKIIVSLHGEYDEIVQDADSGEMIKAKHIISKTSGAPFTKEQLKELSRVKAVTGDDSVIETDLITFPKQEQIEKLNEAKASKKTGEFELTFAAPDGTEATVTVYLTEEGLDGAAQGSGKPSCGADSVSHPTGGNSFGEEELTELCRARGKDENGDNAVLKIDEEQLLKLNRAKAAGKTGSFDVTFSMEAGPRVKVAVALTGEHTVTFDTDGGQLQEGKKRASRRNRRRPDIFLRAGITPMRRETK